MKKKILKILRLLIWVGLISAFFTGLAFAYQKQQALKLKNIEIILDDQHNFVSVLNIKNLLQSKKIKEGYLLSKIDLHHVENAIQVNPYVEKTNVFKTLEGNLYVNISQRNPIVRVFNAQKENFYIDKSGFKFPPSNLYTARVLIATGYIFEKVNDNASLIKNIRPLQDKVSDNIILEIFNMASYISSDPFWSSQVTMIYVNQHKEFELTTLVGHQRVLFGNTQNMNEKFNKLRILYREGFSRMGWDTYHDIDLRFNNQIVCKKNI